jgi:hypothetical protein
MVVKKGAVVGSWIRGLSEREVEELYNDYAKSFGECVKFRCISQGYRVIWICDKLEGDHI